MSQSTSPIARSRTSPIEMTPEEFRSAGHQLIDRLADFLAQMPEGRVTSGENAETIRDRIGADRPLPEKGSNAEELLRNAAEQLIEHSLFNGHPRFLGFITSSAAPIGALGDLLASSINPNVGGWILSPMATEVELQTIRWTAELLGYPVDCGGLLVSGGNMANFVGFICARRSKAPWSVRTEGMASTEGVPLRVYATSETHTWLHKAADLFGLGTESIHWIEADEQNRMDLDSLESAIRRDREAGDLPFLVVGNAGTVSTGSIDPLAAMAQTAKAEGLWFHVDGAYGACAAVLPEAHPDLKALALADSVAFDPHKWLYAPLEAGCVLIRDPKHLVEAFSYRPSYYAIDFEETNFYEIGFQNSRGFRALKVWLALQQVGRSGYETMIREDIGLARRLFENVAKHPDLEGGVCGLSIATFRYVPRELRGRQEEAGVAEYLDELNRAVMETLNRSGDAFLSNAVVRGRFWLRACIVNFRTSEEDIDLIPEIVASLGQAQADLLRRDFR